LPDVALELAVALRLAESVGGALERLGRGPPVLLRTGPSGRAECIRRLRQRLCDLRLGGGPGLGRLSQLCRARLGLIGLERVGAFGQLFEVVGGLLRVAVGVGLLVAGRGARGRARKLGETCVPLGCLRIGHARQLLLDGADPGERRLAIRALLAKLARQLAELSLELLATGIGVLDVLFADLVGDVLDALGHALGSLPSRPSLFDDVVLRVRPRDEEQGHRHPRADDGERTASQARPKRAAHVDRVEPGTGVDELAGLERIVGLVSGQLEGRPQPLAQDQLLVRATGGLDQRRTRAEDEDRPRQHPDPGDAELDEHGVLEGEGAGTELHEGDTEHGRRQREHAGADRAAPPQASSEAAQPAERVGPEAALDGRGDGSVAHRSTSSISSRVACPGSVDGPTPIGMGDAAGRPRRNAQRIPAGTTNRVERNVSNAASAMKVIAIRGHQ
jgi:hypothetical protein